VPRRDRVCGGRPPARAAGRHRRPASRAPSAPRALGFASDASGSSGDHLVDVGHRDGQARSAGARGRAPC
jgi:hypothetical protein